jgi:peptidoglycan/xylan/chitin deacetylase (PgdA/CDA1 family)
VSESHSAGAAAESTRIKLHVLFTMDVECPGEGSNDAGFTDWTVGANAVRGYARVLAAEGWPATFFIVPEAALHYRDLLKDVQAQGAELALHVHPQDLGYSEYLGAYGFEEQSEILRKAMAIWQDALDLRPYSFRPGNFSANDSTFPVLEHLGFRQGSVSAPERRMPSLRAVWTTAPKDPHFVNRANRLLPGDSSFLEVPVTVDWASMIWGGITPLDLRVEAVDARSHSFTMDKNLRRMLDQKISPMALVPMTHNYFDYSSPAEFRAMTLCGMIEHLKRLADRYALEIAGMTLSQFRRTCFDKE